MNSSLNFPEKWINSIYSDGSAYFVSNPLPKRGEEIVISVQVMEDSPVKHVILHTKLNGVDYPIKMDKVSVKNGLARYEALYRIWEKELRYQFFFLTDDCIYYYNQAGITTYIPSEAHDFRILTDYQQPEWVKNAVFYQIFPERFCNGNPENDVKDGEYVFDGYPAIKVKDWNSVPKKYDEAHCLDFYGGDLEGVIQKIPYLKKLGITAVYLNPIFYAATVHKYDCLDYFHVDPHFGGDEIFAKLCEELHENGMKIIIDVSINHTGIANRWFNRDGLFFPKSEGAFNNPDSIERKFYFFGEDNSYKSWWGVTTLPTLNYTSQELRARLYKDSDSLVKKWLKPPYSIDGWRFDVADTMARNDAIQLHHEVWPEIRKSIKEENPQAYILAEDWSDCNEFLNGDEWDSPMNYFSTARPIRQFYGEPDIFNGRVKEMRLVKYKMTANDLHNRIQGYYSRMPFVIRQVQFNLLDSHDVSRLHNNPEIPKDAYKGAVIMLFTLPGAANVYYGDEVGIDGRIEDIEGCRYPMPWKENFEDLNEYKLYKTLAEIKVHNKEFDDGGFKVLWDKGYIFAYARFTSEKLWITIASNSNKDEKISFPVDIFGTQFKAAILPHCDELGENFNASIHDGIFEITVPKGKAYLIKLNP